MLLVKNLESILQIFKILNKISIWIFITKEGGLDKVYRTKKIVIDIWSICNN